MRKEAKKSPLDDLSEATQNELFVLLQKGTTYEQAVEWVLATHGIATSVPSLQRFWKRVTRKLMSREVFNAIASGRAFDRIVDETPIDTRMRKALKTGFFEAKARGIPDMALDFAKVALKANKDKRDASESDRLLASERQRDELQKTVADLLARIEALTKAAESKAPVGLTEEGRRQVEQAMGVL